VKFVKAFGQFWYDFIIGDDWKIAAAVVLALTVVVVALTTKLFGDQGLAITGGLLIAAFFTISLLIDVRPRPDR
jgi:hypothetical protein